MHYSWQFCKCFLYYVQLTQLTATVVYQRETHSVHFILAARALEVKVVFYPLRTLRQMLVHPKDPVPVEERKGVVYSVEERKGVVYSIPCQDCSNVYVGQMGRCLKQCLSEHRCALRKGNTQASDVL